MSHNSFYSDAHPQLTQKEKFPSSAENKNAFVPLPLLKTFSFFQFVQPGSFNLRFTSLKEEGFAGEEDEQRPGCVRRVESLWCVCF